MANDHLYWSYSSRSRLLAVSYCKMKRRNVRHPNSLDSFLCAAVSLHLRSSPNTIDGSDLTEEEKRSLLQIDSKRYTFPNSYRYKMWDQEMHWGGKWMLNKETFIHQRNNCFLFSYFEFLHLLMDKVFMTVGLELQTLLFYLFQGSCKHQLAQNSKVESQFEILL